MYSNILQNKSGNKSRTVFFSVKNVIYVVQFNCNTSNMVSVNVRKVHLAELFVFHVVVDVVDDDDVLVVVVVVVFVVVICTFLYGSP